jgi:hypothetical protein
MGYGADVKDLQLMIDNLGALTVRQQRDILLDTVRNLADYFEHCNSISSDQVIAEFLHIAADGKLGK